MQLYLNQFNILLWKCYLLKKRHYIATFFEFFLPLLTSIIMVITVSSFGPGKAKTKSDTGYQKGPVIYNESVFDLNLNLNLLVGLKAMKFEVNYLLAPNTTCTESIMQEFEKELKNRVIGPPSLNYHWFHNKEELDISFNTYKDSNMSVVVGILFNNDCPENNLNEFLKKFSFTIKTLAPATPNIAALFPDKRNAGPSDENLYIKGNMLGFIETQNLVNLAYLNLVKNVQGTSKKFTISNLQASKYPYPAFVERPPSSLIDFIPSVLIYGFIIFFPIVVMRQAAESYNRIREMFKLMGLNDFVYFGSTFVCYLIQLVPQALLLTFLYTFRFNGSTAVFNFTNPVLIYIILLLYTVNLILLGFLISIPFKRPIIAVIVSLIVYVLTDNLRYFIDPKFNRALNSNAINTIQLLSCLLPNSSINFVMRLLSILELYSSGGNFSNLFETTYQYGSLSVGLILIMNLVSAVLYSLLIWYLDSTWPLQYGIIKPWYFPINPLLKLFRKNAKRNEQAAEQSTTSDLKYFEEEKTKNKIKISVQNVSKNFGKKTAVSNINLNLHENHLIALLGHNGAGKTTLMNMITGLFPATSGRVLIDGFNLQDDPKEARKSISLCPQHNALYDELTAYEHLIIYGTIKGNSTFVELNEEIGDLLKNLYLLPKRDTVSSSYSGGMKRKLNLAIALVGRSKIVVADEPSSGMDPESRRAVWDVLLKEKRSRTILLTTHFIEEADVLGDRIFIMANGEAKCYGSPIFLKRIFGVGYQLRIAKDQKFNGSNEARVKLNDFIRQYFKNSTVMNENIGEVIYSLDTSKEEDIQRGLFPEFFKNFEQIKDELFISTFGVTVTQLEDIFLKILNLSTNETMTESKNAISVSSGYDSSYNLTGTSLNTSMHSESIAPFLLEDGSQNDRICDELLLLRQRFYALLIKRLNHSKRYWPMIIFQVIIPVVIFWLILYLDAYLRPSWRDETSFVLENELYGQTNGFFKDNTGDKALYGAYNMTQYNASMKITQLPWEQDPNDYLLGKTTKDTISTYIKEELYGAVVRVLSKGDEPALNLEIWYNNEASHSLPLSISAIYNSLLDYVNDKQTTDYQNVKLINEPFPNQFGFLTKLLIINGLKVMWSLLCSLSLPFLAASYAMFPVHEYITKSKLLQKMSGANSYLYWFSTFLYDLATHSIVCGLILLVFKWQDTNKIFTAFGESMSALFVLLFLFGLASMQVSYTFSRLFGSIGTGFLIIVVFNLIFGCILAVVDFLLIFLVSTNFITKAAYDVVRWIFRMCPIFAMATGISNIYMLGSKGHICDNLSKAYLESNCLRMPIIRGCCLDLCEGDECYRYESPYRWNTDGILMEVFSLALVFIIAAIVNLSIEENLPKKLFGLLSSLLRSRRMQQGNVLLINGSRAERYLENSSEDSDVIQEKQRVNTLVEQGNKNNLPQSMLVHHLTKMFNKFVAVDDLSFALDERECFGLLGVNGAGKTTTFKMLVGDVEPTDGTAYIKNVNLRENLKEFQRNIGYCPQFDALLDNLTGEEMLYLFGRLRGVKESKLPHTVDCIIRMVDLTEHAKFVCSNYSGGNKRKLSLGLALIGLPKIIFLDEPSSGVDASARRKIWKTLVSVKEKFNCSIVLTSHSMDECEALCSRIAIMCAGKFKCLGSVQELRKKYGRGYTLTIKLKPECLEQPFYLSKLKDELRTVFPSAVLKDHHELLLEYQIIDNSLRWSFLFAEMDQIRSDYNLDYYVLSDCTLEQIFIQFARTNQLQADRSI